MLDTWRDSDEYPHSPRCAVVALYHLHLLTCALSGCETHQGGPGEAQASVFLDSSDQSKQVIQQQIPLPPRVKQADKKPPYIIQAALAHTTHSKETGPICPSPQNALAPFPHPIRRSVMVSRKSKSQQQRCMHTQPKPSLLPIMAVMQSQGSAR